MEQWCIESLRGAISRDDKYFCEINFGSFIIKDLEGGFTVATVPVTKKWPEIVQSFGFNPKCLPVPTKEDKGVLKGLRDIGIHKVYKSTYSDGFRIYPPNPSTGKEWHMRAQLSAPIIQYIRERENLTIDEILLLGCPFER